MDYFSWWGLIKDNLWVRLLSVCLTKGCGETCGFWLFFKTPFLKRWEYKWFSCVSGQFFYWHFLCLNKKWEVLKKLSDNTYFSWLLQAWIETTKKTSKIVSISKLAKLHCMKKCNFLTKLQKNEGETKVYFCISNILK